MLQGPHLNSGVMIFAKTVSANQDSSCQSLYSALVKSAGQEGQQYPRIKVRKMSMQGRSNNEVLCHERFNDGLSIALDQLRSTALGVSVEFTVKAKGAVRRVNYEAGPWLGCVYPCLGIPASQSLIPKTSLAVSKHSEHHQYLCQYVLHQ